MTQTTGENAKHTCALCGEAAAFAPQGGAPCPRCGAARRASDLARTILRTALGDEDGSLEAGVPRLVGLHIYLTPASSPLHRQLSRLPDFVCSEQLDGVAPGETKDGVRCEDPTRLRLESNRFDLVVSQDRLQCASDPEAAFLEIRRVVKPGGHHVFTVPYHPSDATRRRAMLDAQGKVVHLLPAHLWGDPAAPEPATAGKLVFTDFGNDLPAHLASLGMPTERLEFGGSPVFLSRNLKMAFTGERFVPESGAPLLAEYEHLHRYAAALQLAEGKEVLDIACGEGYGAALLATCAKKVVGMDCSAQTVAHACARYRHIAALEFRQGLCESIPLPDRSVDLVVSMETIEHSPRQREFVAEVRRVLRAGGAVFASTPNAEESKLCGQEPNPFHSRELPLDEFRALLAEFFPWVALFGQRVLPVSMIFPLGDWQARARWWTGSGGALRAPRPDELAPKFYLALCSDAPQNLPSSVFSDLARQGVLDHTATVLEHAQLLREFRGAAHYAHSLERQLDTKEKLHQHEKEQLLRQVERERSMPLIRIALRRARDLVLRRHAKPPAGPRSDKR